MSKQSQMSQPETDQPMAENVKCQKSFFLLVLLFFFISACDKGPQIPEEKFIKVYVDFLIIQDTTTANTFSLDSIKTLVFNRHEVTPEQYDATIEYYNSQPEKWVAFFDSATAYVEDLKKEDEK